jgi:hypothetical protein
MPTLLPTNTVVPTFTPVADANIEIMYNGDTLVVHNISTGNINLSGIQFVLAGADAADSVLFLAEEWGLANNNLQQRRCAQVWRVEFVELPAGQPPANECHSRSAFRSTVRTFWIIDSDKTVFEVRQDGNVLAQCEAAAIRNDTILRCRVRI